LAEFGLEGVRFGEQFQGYCRTFIMITILPVGLRFGKPREFLKQNIRKLLLKSNLSTKILFILKNSPES